MILIGVVKSKQTITTLVECDDTSPNVVASATADSRTATQFSTLAGPSQVLPEIEKAPADRLPGVRGKTTTAGPIVCLEPLTFPV